jgi:hypothetical protein
MKQMEEDGREKTKKEENCQLKVSVRKANALTRVTNPIFVFNS